MQLFITNNFKFESNNIFINERRIYDQLKKVLRAKKWYIFYLQEFKHCLDKGNKGIKISRYKVEFLSYQDDLIKWHIIEVDEKIYNFQNVGIAIANLNKYDKMEDICQKLTQIGIENIYFFPARRSIIKEISENKLYRMKKIILEAAEQSWSWIVPNIFIIDKFEKLFELDYNNFLIADFVNSDIVKCNFWQKNSIGIIWPEWWFTDEERNNFIYNLKNKDLKFIKLSNNIFRSETAAIVTGWLLKSI